MDPYYQDDTVTLWHGDCLDVLRGMPDASIHAVVTDPPYGLGFMGKEWDTYGGRAMSEVTRAAQLSSGAGWTAKPYGASAKPAKPAPGEMRAFQSWCEQWAAECLRVLKPGGHLLAFGGSRTWHRLAAAIEDAGFEIRDSIAWLYGSGFPKSLDVSKAIDKRAEENVETKQRIRLVAEVIRTHREAKGMERAEVSLAVVGTPSGACWNWEHHQLPSVDMWPAIKRTLDIPDIFDGLIHGDRAQFIAAEREVVGAGFRVDRKVGAVNYGSGTEHGHYDITAPATPDAAAWQGWGTALKPAFEPVVVARKPLTGTVAATVLTHGTGALNVDACRVGETVETWHSSRSYPFGGGGATYGSSGAPTESTQPPPAGRWPTNVVLDQHTAAELDRQSGETVSRIGKPRGAANGDGWGMTQTGAEYSDTGGASRFFPTFRYEAKAPTSERPRAGQVAHPTVKPLDLMRWLVRLVTPPGGLVLDPFAGSGTTAEACVIEGFRCVTIEREADYLPLITARLSKPLEPVLDLGALA